MLNKMLRGLLAILLLATLAGCNKSEDKAAEKMIEQALEQDGTKADVQVSGEKISMKTDQGEQIQVDGENTSVTNAKGEIMVMGSQEKGIQLPDDFPKNIYIYEGAIPFGSMKSDDGYALMLSTPDPLDKVAGQYKAKLQEGGWVEKTVISNPEMQMLEYELGTQGLIITITPNSDSKTQIVLQAKTIEPAPTPAPEMTPEEAQTPEAAATPGQ